jgi:serine/threonine protein phosphatase PrpC
VQHTEKFNKKTSYEFKLFYNRLQGDTVIIANVGDSRAVLATTSDDGSLVAVQLTVDFKPNLPR